jgi:hypothetical protein
MFSIDVPPYEKNVGFALNHTALETFCQHPQNDI